MEKLSFFWLFDFSPCCKKNWKVDEREREKFITLIETGNSAWKNLIKIHHDDMLEGSSSSPLWHWLLHLQHNAREWAQQEEVLSNDGTRESVSRKIFIGCRHFDGLAYKTSNERRTMNDDKVEGDLEKQPWSCGENFSSWVKTMLCLCIQYLFFHFIIFFLLSFFISFNCLLSMKVECGGVAQFT